MTNTDVAIVGSGPYGLSLAAHLKCVGVEHRIFGEPMQFWRENVPPGMLLKSVGSSSDLFDPGSRFTIADFYAEQKLAFAEKAVVPSDVFVKYGEAFQQRFVPHLDTRRVASVARDGDGFQLRLEDGETFRAKRVVIAVGIREFTHIPEPLASLPATHVSHSVIYGPTDALRGGKIAVVGSGASAIDLAASLHESGTDVTILSRRSHINFHSEPRPPKFYQSLMAPDTPIGGGWALWFYANAPQLFRLLPEATRFRIVSNALGPSPGWFMTERVRGRIPILSGQRLANAEIVDGRVKLTNISADGERREMTFDKVVAATGFRIDLSRLSILERGLRDAIATSGGAPVLSGSFETSVKGCYFIGATTAPCFGPVMRFVAGAGFTVRKVAAALKRSPVMAHQAPQPELVKS